VWLKCFISKSFGQIGMSTRFIDNFTVLLLDMGNTFMFGCNRFGKDIDYSAAYSRCGGAVLDMQTLSVVMDALLTRILTDYRNPACYDAFGTVGEYLRELPVAKTLPSEELDILERVFGEHEVGHIPYSHVRVLRELNRSHVLGLVSNIWSNRSFFEAEFKKVSILDLFKVIVWSSDYGSIKPSARLFREALDALGVHPEDVLFVGDNPKRDIVGAKAVGMRAAWLRNDIRPLSPTDPIPDCTVSDLSELLVLEAKKYMRQSAQ
jgi:HAD superfamily hydrolase (TIGR01509 family)